jgi:hypothetical protein
MTIETVTPLPCPFCGYGDIAVCEGSTFRWLVAYCDECGACAGEVRKQTTPPGTPEQWLAEGTRRAIDEWNKRVNS